MVMVRHMLSLVFSLSMELWSLLAHQMSAHLEAMGTTAQEFNAVLHNMRLVSLDLAILRGQFQVHGLVSILSGVSSSYKTTKLHFFLDHGGTLLLESLSTLPSSKHNDSSSGGYCHKRSTAIGPPAATPVAASCPQQPFWGGSHWLMWPAQGSDVLPSNLEAPNFQ